MKKAIKEFLILSIFGGIIIFGKFHDVLFGNSEGQTSKKGNASIKKALILLFIVFFGFILVVDILDHLFIREDDRLINRVWTFIQRRKSNGTENSKDGEIEMNGYNGYSRLDDK